MRNLKRVLSLALASAMLLGMMVMGAGAADTTTYADANSITNKEAVAVMSAIGTFQGADGKFNPTGALTRESAAKIITYLVMGKAAADDLSTSAAPFTDVAANRWSAGAIAYCSANGIITGDGQGHFYPELTVNGYAFAKMVLGALGYNATTEKMVGTGWESNVSKLVSKAGLKSGISAALSKDMTREQAAQMAFNALSAMTVTYVGGLEYTNPDGSKFTMGATRELSDDSFAKQNYADLKGEARTVEGVPSKVWTLGTTKIGTFATSADYTFTAATKVADLGLDDFTVKSGATITKNTQEKNIATITDLDSLAAATAAGRKVELYVNDTTKTQIDSVVITDTYLSTVANVNTVNKTVTLSGVGVAAFSPVTAKDNEALYNALAEMGKDAKVLVTAKADKTVLTVAAPTTENGTYSSKASGTRGDRTIGGTKYVVAATFPQDKLDAMKTGTTYDAYFDTYGNLIAADAEAAAETSYGFINGMERAGSASSGYTFNVNVVLKDGTQEWVEVSTVNSTAVSDIKTSAAFAEAVFGVGSTMDTVGVVSYAEKSDGTYTIKNVAKGATAVDSNGDIASTPTVDTYYAFTGLDIKKNESKFFEKTGNVLGSNKTIFLVQNKNTFTAYEGVKNVPNLDDATGFVLVSKNSKTASLVVVNTKTNAVDASALAYLVSGDYETNYDETLKQEVYIYDAIVAGVPTKLTTTVTKAGAAASGDANLTAGMYTVDYDSNKYGVKLVAAAEDSTNLTQVGKHATLDNGTITTYSDWTVAADGTASGTFKNSFVTGDDFKAVVVDDEGKAFSVDADSVKYYTSQAKAYVVLDSDKQFATTLIIVEPLAP